MYQDRVEVNGLVLPSALIAALREGQWSGMGASTSLAAVFGSEPVRPKFFTLEDIKAVNGYWKDESDPLYIGEADPARYPGDIDPERSLLVAELGPDQLIALDYRRSAVPEVIYATDDGRSPWRVVSSSIEELLARLTEST